jgi:ATP/ADP translocase
VIDYSVFRGAKELLYIPLSFDCRYRAKELIDVFGYRFGKGGMSMLIVLLQRAKVPLVEPTMGLVAASAAAVWAVLTIPLGKGYATAKQTATAASNTANAPQYRSH